MSLTKSFDVFCIPGGCHSYIREIAEIAACFRRALERYKIRLLKKLTSVTKILNSYLTAAIATHGVMKNVDLWV
jgi:hypothetical protein